MLITKTDRGFRVTTSYDQRLIKEIKAIPGRVWVPGEKYWFIPAEQELELKYVYDGYHLRKATEAPAQVGPIPPMPELTVDIPLLMKPYGFQCSGIAYNLIHERTIIGDKPGLGKTIQAIGTNMATGAFPTLVICPSTLMLNWQKEWYDITGKKALILNDKIANTWHRYLHAGLVDIVIVNYESLKKYFVADIKKPKGKAWRLENVIFNEHIDLFKTVIIDEGHRCKDPKTQWTKFTAGITKGKRYIYHLTGTPIVNKTEDLISQLAIIGRLGEFGGMKYFKERYCKKNDYLEELSYRLRTTCFYQRKKSDVLKELPDKTRKVMLCDITNKDEYAIAKRDLEAYLRVYTEKTDLEIRKSMAGELMVQFNVLRSISARGKLNEVYSYVDDLHAAGEKVVLFYNQNVIRDTLKQRYPQALAISGEESTEERHSNVQRFQNDPRANIILCSIKAGGVGITLTAASNLGMLEWPWHAADADQCEDRIHRITQTDKCFIAYFLGKNTVDETMYALNEEKRALGDAITGNRDDTMVEMVDRMAESILKGLTTELTF